MRFHSNHNNKPIEVVANDAGNGYAVDNQHRVVGNVLPGSNYEYFEFCRHEGIGELPPDEAEQVAELQDDHGDRYTLIPLRKPLPIDLFARICAESVRIAGVETVQGMVDAVETSDKSKADDVTWAVQHIRRKFGPDAEWQFTTNDVVAELMKCARDRGIDPSSPSGRTT